MSCGQVGVVVVVVCWAGAGRSHRVCGFKARGPGDALLPLVCMHAYFKKHYFVVPQIL